MKKFVKALLTVCKIASLAAAVIVLIIILADGITATVNYFKYENDAQYLTDFALKNVFNFFASLYMIFGSIVAGKVLKKLPEIKCKKDAIPHGIWAIVAVGFGLSGVAAGICMLVMKDKFYQDQPAEEQPAEEQQKEEAE